MVLPSVATPAVLVAPGALFTGAGCPCKMRGSKCLVGPVPMFLIVDPRLRIFKSQVLTAEPFLIHRLFLPAQTPRSCSHPLREIGVCISLYNARIIEHDNRTNDNSDTHAIVSATRNQGPNDESLPPLPLLPRRCETSSQPKCTLPICRMSVF